MCIRIDTVLALERRTVERTDGIGKTISRCACTACRHAIKCLHFRISFTSPWVSRNICFRPEAPRAGSGVVRIDPLRFRAECRIRRLNQALSVLSLSLGFFWCMCCVLLTRAPFCVVLFVCSVAWLFLLSCQYQCKWLTRKTRLQNDLCVDGDVNPTHLLTLCSSWLWCYSSGSLLQVVDLWWRNVCSVAHRLRRWCHLLCAAVANVSHTYLRVHTEVVFALIWLLSLHLLLHISVFNQLYSKYDIVVSEYNWVLALVNQCKKASDAVNFHEL